MVPVSNKPDGPSSGKAAEAGGAPEVRTIFVASDDDDDDETQGCIVTNKCTREEELRDADKPDFDYDRYQEYCRLKNLQTRLHRLVDGGSEEMKSGRKYSDESLKKQFVQRYGPVDFNDPLMIKRLEVMKTTLEEVATQPLDEGEILNELLDEGIEGDGGALWIDDDDEWDAEIMLESKFSEKFTAKELQSFRSFNPKDAEGDWFHLPRGDLKTIREEQLEKRKKETDNEDSGTDVLEFSDHDSAKKRAPIITRLQNLHLYDPKFEFCFSEPYRIFDATDDYGQVEIPKMLAFRILELLNKFPFGISSNLFWEEFYRKHGKFPALGIPLSEIFTYFPDEVYIVSNDETTFPEPLVFPGFLQGFVDPKLILKRFYHIVMCIMSRHPFILTNKVFECVEKEFGFKFDPYLWGFRNKAIFLSWCIKYFQDERSFIVHCVTFIKDFQTSYEDFLSVNSPYLITRMNALSGGLSQEKQARRPVPKGCIGKHFIIPRAADSFSEGDVCYMDLVAIVDMHRLSFVDFPFSREHSQYYKQLQTFPLKDDIEFFYHPSESQIEAGMYVVVLHTWDKRGYYRGRIIEKHETEPQKYWVYGIDVGFFAAIHLVNIRFMPVKVAEQMAHAVPARLMIEHPSYPGQKQVEWEGWTSRLFDSFMKGCFLSVRFVKGTDSVSLGCKKWEVKCSVLKKSDLVLEDEEPEIVHYSLSDELYQKMKEKLKIFAKVANKKPEKTKKKAHKSKQLGKKIEPSLETISESATEANLAVAVATPGTENKDEKLHNGSTTGDKEVQPSTSKRPSSQKQTQKSSQSSNVEVANVHPQKSTQPQPPRKRDETLRKIIAEALQITY